MSLTDEERQERKPEAIQREILNIDKQLLDLGPKLTARKTEELEAKAECDVMSLRMKILKERRSGLQSVLKSLSIV